MKHFKYEFEYRIDRTGPNPNCYKITITKQDQILINTGCFDLVEIDGWKIRRSSTMEVRPNEKIFYIVGGCGMSHNHFIISATPAQLSEIKKVLEKFKTEFCGYVERDHQHPLTKMFASPVNLKKS